MKTAIDRLYYSITDVSKMIGEEQHVLRYWEREFSQLKPQKNRAGNRIYADKDLQVLMVIKKLLREERYTVAGAREYLRLNGVQEEALDLVSAMSEVGSRSEQPQVGDEKVNLADVREISAELRAIAGVLRRRVAVG